MTARGIIQAALDTLMDGFVLFIAVLFYRAPGLGNKLFAIAIAILVGLDIGLRFCPPLARWLKRPVWPPHA